MAAVVAAAATAAGNRAKAGERERGQAEGKGTEEKRPETRQIGGTCRTAYTRSQARSRTRVRTVSDTKRPSVQVPSACLSLASVGVHRPVYGETRSRMPALLSSDRHTGYCVRERERDAGNPSASSTRDDDDYPKEREMHERG